MMAAQTRLEEAFRRFKEACRELLMGRAFEHNGTWVCLAESGGAIYTLQEFGIGVLREGVDAVKSRAVRAVEVVARDTETGEEAGLELTSRAVRAWANLDKEKTYELLEVTPLGTGDVERLVKLMPPATKTGTATWWWGVERPHTAEGTAVAWAEAEPEYVEEGEVPMEVEVHARARSVARARLEELSVDKVRAAADKVLDLAIDLALASADELLEQIDERLRRMVERAEEEIWSE